MVASLHIGQLRPAIGMANIRDEWAQGEGLADFPLGLFLRVTIL
jgi:hypothetical protein